MNKILQIIFILTLCLPMFLYAENLEEFQQDLQFSMESWLTNDISSNDMFSRLNELEVNLEQKSSDWESVYWKSRLSLIKGQILYEQGKKRASIRELQKCLSLAEESNQENERSDTWRTMSEANSLLMIQKGILYIIANFSLPQDQANRALELDPDNARASLVTAQFLSNAPAIAGGNLEEGLALLKRLYERDDLSGEDRFAVLQSLSEIYIDNDRMRDARIYCRLALNLYPGNIRCNELLSEIEEELEG